MFKNAVNPSRSAVVLAVLVMVALGVPAAQAAPSVAAWAGNRVSQQEAWSPGTATFVTGDTKGYSEGETAAFRVTVDGDADGQELKFIVCLDLNVSNKGFGFTKIEPWDTTHTPGTPPASVNGPVSGFSAGNGTITGVTFLGDQEEDGYSCHSGYIGYLVEFTITDASQLTYIVYGGHLAQAGDEYVSTPGGPVGIVPASMGAAAVNGTFQAYLEGEGLGEKTVNFKSSDVGVPLAVGLLGLGRGSDGTTPANAVAAASALLGLSLLVWRQKRVATAV